MKLLLFCLVFVLQGVSGFTQNNTDALWNYHTGRDFESRGRMSEADVYYNEAIRLAIEDISRSAASRDSYAALTWALQRQRKFSDVIIWGERGLRLYTDEYRIVETMGEAYFYLEDYDRSMRFMQRYTNAVPQGERTGVAYFFIGEIFRMRRQFLHADIAYSTAVRLEPGNSLWWYRLGIVREAAGDLSYANAAYERTLRLNPNYREAREALTRSQRWTGENE